jgi:hypothetical protein
LDLENIDALDERSARDKIIRLYKKFLDYCAECNFQKPLYFTPDEFAWELGLVFPTKQPELDRLTSLFCLSFYGNYFPPLKAYRSFVKDLSVLGSHIKPLGVNDGWQKRNGLQQMSGPTF